MAAPRIPADALRRGLRIATWSYLTFPVLVFVVGFVRPAVGIPLAGLTAWAAWRVARPARGAAPDGEGEGFGLAALLVGAIPIVLHAAICGVGGVGYQTGDWPKHEAMLRDLVFQSWPVAYVTAEGPVALVYYTAYYLPAALVGKLAGWTAANVALFVWHLAGVLLVWLWLVALSRVHPLAASVLFLGTWSLRVWENTLENGIENTLREMWEGARFAWQRQFVYPWTNGTLFWAPQHGLGTWLGAALLLDDAGRGRLPLALLLGLLALWSPLGAVGVAAVAAVVGWPGLRELPAWLRGQLSGAGAVGVALAGMLGLYIAARWSAYDIPEVFTSAVPERSGFLQPRGGSSQDVSRSALVWLWGVSVLTEILLPVLPILVWHRRIRLAAASGTLVLVCTGLLVLLPLFKYGHYSDLMMRGSLAPYFVLMVCALDLVAQLRRQPIPALAMLCVLGTGLLHGAAEISRQTRRSLANPSWVQIDAPEDVPDLFKVHVNRVRRRYGFVQQYLGSMDSPFFGWLARPIEPRTIPTLTEEPRRRKK